jgi:uncharacterized membrane protein YjjP (DUF1212 family)
MEGGSGVGSSDELPLLREFVVQLGGAMTNAGDSVDTINETLQAITQAYGSDDFEFFVLPTGIFVESGEAASASVLLSTNKPNVHLRFDQISAIYELVHRAERAEVTPFEGLAELSRIERLPPSFKPAVRVAGHAVLTAGLALLLQPTLGGLAAALALGTLVGLLKLPRLATLELIFPIVASFTVSLVVFAFTHWTGVGDNPIRVLIAPLATFLPGGLLTIATVELAAGQTIAGSSRLVAGAVRLALLAFGILAASSLVGMGPEALSDDPYSRLGWWAPWVGVLFIALGDYLHFCAPFKSLPWIVLVLLVAYGGQAIGGAVFGGELSGFFGAVAMTPLVHWIDRRPFGTPSLVTFLPAFWLLVPGALGLIGITEVVGLDQEFSASSELQSTITTIASIALGVLIGSAAYRTATVGVEKVVNTLPTLPLPLGKHRSRR